MSWLTPRFRTHPVRRGTAAKATGPKVDLLRSLPGLRALRDHDLARLAAMFDDVHVDAGTVLAREGQSCRELSLIVEGWAAVTRGGESLNALGPEDFLGETAILERGPHSSTVTTQTPMRVLVASRESCGALRHHPDVLRQIATNLAGRLWATPTPSGVADTVAVLAHRA